MKGQEKMTKYEFREARFMSAVEKRQVLRVWETFVANGFQLAYFTKALYHHLTLHCSFIAHYDRAGFWETYFRNPDDTQRFLDQFDRSKGCVSVEYGMAHWIQGGNDVCSEYYDINTAMVEVLQPLLPEIRRNLKSRQIAQAEVALGAVQGKLAQLRATG